MKSGFTRRRTAEVSDFPLRVASLALPLLTGVLLALSGCDDGVSPSNNDDNGDRPSNLFEGIQCSVPNGDFVGGGVGSNAVPTLQNPTLVAPDHAGASYVTDEDRVIGVVVDGEPIAVPYWIMYKHEVVNLDPPTGASVAVTYCPLTATALAFDRTPIGGAELGVSGALFRNNLVLYDRNDEFSLWLQMWGQARCGVRDGTVLPQIPTLDLTWGAWKRLHPDTRVVSSDTGFNRDYSVNPYRIYEQVGNEGTVQEQSNPDSRRLNKERVFGIPSDRPDGGAAYPFLELDAGAAPTFAVHDFVNATSVVVFWDREAQGAAGFRRNLGSETLTFSGHDGAFRDAETGSTWRLDGLAVSGPLEGERLVPITEAYTAFWFAWTDFHPDTQLWTR